LHRSMGFQDLAISTDLRYLAIADGTGMSAYLINLDQYFSVAPLANQASIPKAHSSPSNTVIDYIKATTGPFKPTTSSSSLHANHHNNNNDSKTQSVFSAYRGYDAADNDTGTTTLSSTTINNPLRLGTSSLSPLFPFAHRSDPHYMPLSRWFELQRTSDTSPHYFASPSLHANGFNMHHPSNTVYNVTDTVGGPFLPSGASAMSSFSSNALSSLRASGKAFAHHLLLDSETSTAGSKEQRSIATLKLAISPTSLICRQQFDLKTSPSFTLFQRTTGEQLPFGFESMVGLLLFNRDYSWYWLSSEGLYVQLHDQTREQLLSNCIMFEGTGMAEQLCVLNGWDRKALLMNALQLGLRYRQVSVVRSALYSLGKEQQLEGSQMLLQYAEATASMNRNDRIFLVALLQIGMRFVTSIIKEQAHQQAPTFCLQMAAILEKLRHCYLSSSTEHKMTTRQNSGGFLEPMTRSNGNNKILATSSRARRPRSPSAKLLHNSLHFGSYHERWRYCHDDSEIVGEALLTNTVSLALSFLQWRKEASVLRHRPKRNRELRRRGSKHLAGSKQSPLQSQQVYQYFQNIAEGLVYKAVCEDQLELARTLLVRSGHPNVSLHLKDLAFLTTRRTTRTKLLLQLGYRQPIFSHHLQNNDFDNARKTTHAEEHFVVTSFHDDHPTQSSSERSTHGEKAVSNDHFSEEERAAVDYTLLLEDLYPNVHFTTEYEQLSSSSEEGSITSSNNYCLLAPLSSVQEEPCHSSTSIELASDNIKHDQVLRHSIYTENRADLDDILPDTGLSYGLQLVDVFGHPLANDDAGFFGTSYHRYHSSENDDEDDDDHNDEDDEGVDEYWSDASDEESDASYSHAHFGHFHAAASSASNRVSIAIRPMPFESLGGGSSRRQQQIAVGQGYLHTSLDVVLKWWDNITRERILIEKSYQVPQRELGARLGYFICHNDWKSLVRTIQLDVDASLLEPTQLDALIYSLLPLCSNYIADIMLDTFAQRDIFLTQERENNPHALLRRLCRTKQLFFRIECPRSEQLSSMLPCGRFSFFHTFFVQFCIDNGLRDVLALYVRGYDLPLLQFPPVDPSGSGQSRATSIPDWVSLLGHFCNRLDDIPQASFLSARVHIKPTIRRIQDMLKDGLVLASLATLLYAGPSLAQLIATGSNPKEERWRFDSTTLKDCLKDYPSLLSALFPDEEQTRHWVVPSTSSHQQLQEEGGHRRGDFFTHCHDVSMLQLLEDALPFYVHRIMTMAMGSSGATLNTGGLLLNLSNERLLARTTSQLQPTQQEGRNLPLLSSPSLAEYAHKDALDVYYYLRLGRPFQAFYFFLKEGSKAFTYSHRVEWFDSVSTTVLHNEDVTQFPSPPPSTFSSLPFNTRSSQKQQQQLLLSAEESEFLQRYVRVAAMRHVQSEEVRGACTSFLQTCGLSSDALSIDLEAARRIVAYAAAMTPSGGKAESQSQNESLPHQDEVIRLFLSLDTADQVGREGEVETFKTASQKQAFTPQQEALQLLEQATAFLGQQQGPLGVTIPIEVSSSSLVTVKKSFEKQKQPPPSNTSSWSLVTSFCRLHGLPLSQQHLCNLARANDWISFLHEAQTQQYPLDQLLPIIKTHFNDHSLRSHLVQSLLLLRRKEAAGRSSLHCDAVVAPDEQLDPSTTDDSSGSSNSKDDLFDCILQAQRQSSPGNELLVQAVRRRRPLLAVTAACFHDVHPSQCMLGWLYSSFPAIPHQQKEKDELKGNSHSEQLSYAATTPPSQWTLGDVRKMVRLLCEHHQYLKVQKAFLLFDAGNPFLEYLLFHQAFVQYRFKDCKRHLCQFVAALKSFQQVGPDKDATIFGDKKWQRSVALELVEMLFERKAASAYEQEHLLKVVHHSGLSSKYSRLHSTFNLLQRTGLPLSLLRSPPSIIVSQLLAYGHYNEARTYVADIHKAKSRTHVVVSLHDSQSSPTDEILDQADEMPSGWQDGSYNDLMDCNAITLAEVRALVSNYYSNDCLWLVEEERLNLWKRCHHIFLDKNCDSDISGSFMQEQAFKEGRTAKEQLLLLSQALLWFNGTASTSIAQQEASVSPITTNSFNSTATTPTHEDHMPPMRRYAASTLSFSTSMVSSSLFSSPFASPFRGQSGSVMTESGRYRRLVMEEHTKQGPCRPPEFLQELEKRILLLSVSAEVGLFREGDGQPPLKSSSRSIVAAPAIETTNNSQEFSQLNPGHSLSPLPLAIDTSALHQLIGLLINNDDLHKASQICEQLSIESTDVIVARTMVDIAEGTLSLNAIPCSVLSLITQSLTKGSEGQATINDDPVYQEEEKIRAVIRESNSRNKVSLVLSWLASCLSSHCREYGERVVAQFKVAQKLCKTFKQVREEEDPYSILSDLLRLGKLAFDLANIFVTSNNLDYNTVAKLLANVYHEALQQHLLIETGGPSVSDQHQQIDPTWSDTDFASFVNICKIPHEVGQRFLILMSEREADTCETPSDISHECEVELLVRAYFCFSLSCHLEGTHMVLALVKRRVDTYVKAKKFRHDQFELILRKNVIQRSRAGSSGSGSGRRRSDSSEIGSRDGTSSNTDSIEFRRALHNYISQYHPQDTEKLTMMFLAFNMHREMGDFLRSKAMELLSQQKNKPVSSRKHLLEIMSLYLDAADNYVKDRSFVKGNRCLAMASLMSLQLRREDLKLLNLNNSEARQLLTHAFDNFQECRIVAEAYDLNRISEWTAPLYHQAVMRNNLTFWEEMKQVPHTASSFPFIFTEMTKMFLQDPQRANHMHAFKTFLRTLNDRFLCYDIAKRVGFADLQAEILERNPSLVYWKPPSQ
ncbi:Spg11p, partial [Balamuthia mandrillaris]